MIERKNDELVLHAIIAWLDPSLLRDD